MFIDIPFLNANSLDLHQTPRYAASDLDLHCLLISLLRDARLFAKSFFYGTIDINGLKSRKTQDYCNIKI